MIQIRLVGTTYAGPSAVKPRFIYPLFFSSMTGTLQVRLKPTKPGIFRRGSCKPHLSVDGGKKLRIMSSFDFYPQLL